MRYNLSKYHKITEDIDSNIIINSIIAELKTIKQVYDKSKTNGVRTIEQVEQDKKTRFVCRQKIKRYIKELEKRNVDFDIIKKENKELRYHIEYL